MPKNKVRRKSAIWQEGKMDITFLALVLILLSVGLVMLFSASYAYSYTYFGNSYRFISRQAGFAVFGVALMLIISKIDYNIIKKFSWIIYIVTVGMLVAVLVLPPMSDELGVKRWISIGGFSFQPSEIAKFAIVVIFAAWLSANGDRIKKFRFVAWMVFLLGFVCALVVAEPHLSATILIFCIGCVLLFVGGIQKRWVFAGLGCGVGAFLFLVFSGVVSYGSDRIQYWLDPWADPSGKGYQTIQSLLAIGSGGLLGRGIGQSRQKYLWVPEPHNDFIFSIVCEELGLIGAMIIIGLFCALVWRGFTIAMRAKDRFGTFMAIGLTFQVGLQAILNILVVTNTMPNTGISLPFFSYGGTALVILLAEMGVVLSVSRGSSVKKL